MNYSRSVARSLAVLVVGTVVLSGGCSSGGQDQQIAHADTLARQGRWREAVAEYRQIINGDNKNPRANEQLGTALLQLGQLTQAQHFLLRAAALNPNSPSVHLELGKLYLAGSKLDEAREQAYAVLDKDPASIPASILLGASINANSPDDVPQVIKRLEAASARFGNDATPRLALGVLYSRKGDASSAKRLFREAVTADPKSVAAHSLLREFYLSQQDAQSASAELEALKGLAPRSGPEQVKIAYSYLLLGKRDEAKALLKEGVEAADQPAVAKLLGELALGDGNTEEAAKAVASVLARDSSDVDALVLRGRQHLLVRQTTEAMADIQRAVRQAPSLAPVHYQRGLAKLQSANASAVNAVLDTVLKDTKSELENAITLAGNYPEAALQLAALKTQVGLASDAVDDLGRIIESSPRSVRAKVLLASSLLAIDRVAEAKEVCEQVIAMAPRSPEGHYWAGVALMREDKRREAKAEFEAASKLLPAYTEATSQLVSLDLAERHPDLAQARLKRQIELVPKSAALFYLLGMVNGARADAAGAEAAFLKSIELDPRFVDAHIRLAEVLSLSGRLDQAIVHAEDALRLDPKNGRALMLLGVSYQAKGDVGKARQNYERILALNPRDASAANNLAVLLSDQQGELEGALKFATLARQISPDDPHVSDTLGWILYKRGAFDQAAKLLRTSARQLPESPGIQYHLGMIEQRLGDTIAARQALTKAVASPTSFAGRDEARRALTQLK